MTGMKKTYFLGNPCETPPDGLVFFRPSSETAKLCQGIGLLHVLHVEGSLDMRLWRPGCGAFASCLQSVLRHRAHPVRGKG